jgi:hypothetical protein
MGIKCTFQPAVPVVIRIFFFFFFFYLMAEMGLNIGTANVGCLSCHTFFFDFMGVWSSAQPTPDRCCSFLLFLGW